MLVGAGDPPAADERRALGEMTALVAAVAERRPELAIILAGGMTDHLAAFGDVGRRPGEVVLGPAAKKGVPGGPLAELLLELALPPDDSHRSLGPGAMALAEVLDRRVDVVEIGYDAGSRAAAAPGVGGGPATVDLAVRADGVPRPGRSGRRGGGPASGHGPPGAPTGTGCVIACASSASRRGRTRPATAPRSGWPPPAPPWAGSPRRHPTGTTGRRPTWSWPPAAHGPSRPHRSWPSPSSTCCAGRAPGSSPWTTRGCWRRSGRSRTRTSDGRWWPISWTTCWPRWARS